jgi:hypothetical protein
MAYRSLEELLANSKQARLSGAYLSWLTMKSTLSPPEELQVTPA